MKKSFTPRTCFMFFVLSISFFSFKIQSSPLPKDFTRDQVKKKGVNVSPTYDPARSTWRAEKIKVDGKAPKSSLKALLKGGVYLFNGEKPQSAPTNSYNLDNMKVDDGKLSFVTKKLGRFFWDKPPPFPGVPNLRFQSAHCVIRIKQSLPNSRWHIMNAVSIWQTPQIKGRVFTLKGTDWQEWRIPRKIFPTSLKSNFSFGLQTETPGNKVEIEWIKIGSISSNSYFRKTIQLDSIPVDARLSIVRNDLLSLRVNGARIEELYKKMAETPVKYLVRLKNLAKYFKKGENIITVEIDSLGKISLSSFFLEGMVRGENGKTTIIKTDDTWKGSYEAPKNWEKNDFNDKSWKNCVCLGTSKAIYGKSREGIFLNPPYYGPIEIKNPALDYFLYDEKKNLDFDVRVYPNNFKTSYDLIWELKTCDGEKTVQSGTLATNHDSKRLFEKKLAIPAPEPGVYELYLKLFINGKIVEKRVEEIAVIGKIKQREVIGTSYEDGLDLELEDEIDLCDPQSPYEIISLDANGNALDSPIKNTPLGRYRESSRKVYSMFGFIVEHKRAYEPYLVEVDVPDDEARVMSVRVVEMSRKDGIISNDGSGRKGWAISAPGVYTGFDQAISGKWRKLRFIIFPKNVISGFMFTNNHGGLAAAAAKVRIYRIKNDLPALKIPSPGYRLTGLHTEDIRIFTTTFSGEDGIRFYSDSSNFPHRGFLKQWYATIENMIKYMRFCGENMSIAGIYMYSPDNRHIWHTRKEANVMELMGRMFAANKLKVLLGVEYARQRNLCFEKDVSDEQMANGAYSKKVVSKHGKQLHTGCGDIDNINESSVREGLFDVIDGICESYSKTPGIVGIALQEGKNWSPGGIYGSGSSWKGDSSILDFGYGDPTIAAFERATKIKVPVDIKDKKRFIKRHKWIMENCLEAWVEWRNDSTYEINSEIGRVIKNANPAWKTYIFPIIGGVKEYIEGADPLEVLKKWSFEPGPYKKNDDLVFGSFYQRRIRYAGNPFYYLDMRQWSNDPKVLAIADNATVHLHDGFFESIQSMDDWYFARTLACDYVCPADRGYLKAFATIMSHATPLVMAQTWIDVNMMSGHEQERREMNRVFQVIPPGRYKTLIGESFNQNIVIRACGNDKGTAFYLVNPTRWPVDFSLMIDSDGKGEVRDLAIGFSVPITNGKMSLKLKPFETRIFQISQKTKSKITESHAKIADSETQNAAKFAGEKAKLYQFCLSLPDDSLGKALKNAHIAKSAGEMKLIADTIIKAYGKQDYLTIAKLTEPYPMMAWEASLDELMKAKKQADKSPGTIRVNCASTSSCTDKDGNFWFPDQEWLYGFNKWGKHGPSNVLTRMGLKDSSTVKCQDVFKSESYGMKGYKFKVPNGGYLVKLHFAEFWARNPGDRIFNILIQNKKVVDKLDIYEKTGGEGIPLTLSFPVEVKSGMLSIDFEIIENLPLLNGIEIIPEKLK